MNINLVKAPRSRGRRRYSAEFKAQVIEACMRPGISMAAVALANGLNANLLRRWVTEHREQIPDGSRREALVEAAPRQESAPSLIPISVALPELAVEGEIKIEIHRSQMLVTVTWPVSQSPLCGEWLREILR